MLAVAGSPPRGAPGRWWREWKYDGHRCRVVSERSGRVSLVSRGGRTVTAAFPEVAAAVAGVLAGRMAVLDGELVAPGPGGRPDFERLQGRARTRATPARVAACPVVFVAFDLLACDGVDLTGRPLHERRGLLEDLGLGRDPRLLLSPVFLDVDPDVLLAAAREHGVEGVVSKRSTSVYSAGTRSKAWIKTVLTETGEFAVGGFTQGRARRPDAVGALLLGAPTVDGGLEYVGEVGTGWTRTEHARLVAQLADLTVDECPFTDGVRRLPRGARFVRTELVGRVAYREHRPGSLLRHPAWKGTVHPG